MDEEELAKSLIEAAKETIEEEEERGDDAPGRAEWFDETAALDALIRNEAKRVRGDFTMATDSSDRRTLQKEYETLDRWMGELKQIEALEDEQRAEELKRELRAVVLDEFRKWRNTGAARRRRQQETEAKRKELREKQKAGAGAAGHRRIKDEIELLLKNYSPANESKIETLIDKWRRSGDPSYDPSINLRLRNARKKKDNSDYAL